MNMLRTVAILAVLKLAAAHNSLMLPVPRNAMDGQLPAMKGNALNQPCFG